MHRLVFYPKLALANLVRNRGTYLPYLLACCVSIITFYTLLAINFNDGVGQMRGEAIVQSFTMVGTVILAIFCVVLLFYTNSFLIKRRKKELGLYAILGMEKANIGIVMFFETLFIAIVALALGLTGGALLARLLYLVLLRLVRFPVMLDLPVSAQALGVTAVFFLCVFLLTLLSNLRQVRSVSPIELLGGARQGEREPKASWVLTLVGLACMVAGYVIAIRVLNPVEAILYFLLAAFLVIIGTFCLFTSGSIALLKGLRRNKNYYYTPRHFISVSGMIYRMKQNATGLATICILSCMVLVTVSATVALYAGAEDALVAQFPNEFQLRLSDPADGDTAMAGLDALAERHGVTVKNLRDMRNVFYPAMRGEDGAYHSYGSYDSSDAALGVTLTPLEDYNKSEGQSVALQPGQALVFSTGGVYGGQTLTLDGITYQLTALDTLNGRQAGTPDVGMSVVLVLPDMAAVRAAIDAMAVDYRGLKTGTPPQRELTFDLAGTDAAKQAFYEDYVIFARDTPTSGYIYTSYREDQRQGWYMTHGGFLFLGIYFGVLFLMAAAMIIYYKQLSEGYDDRERYEILQKVGMSGDEVRKTISGQVRTVFFLPLGVAVVHIAVATVTISRALVVFGVFNVPLLVLATAATILLYAFIYYLVYKRTARSYFKLVRRAV